MRNYIIYPTPLIVIEMLEKEGVDVDSIFCPPLICMSNPKNSKNTNFSLEDCGNI